MSQRLSVAFGLTWLALLGGTLALSALAAVHDTLPGDTGIATWAQDLAFPGQALSDFVRAVTFTELILALGAALAVALWLRGHRREAVVFAIGLALLPLLQFAVKELVDRPRPDPELVDIRGGIRSPSFPSGHVMSSVYLYGYLAYVALLLPIAAVRVILLAVSAGVLVLTGPVNVWLGVHWPSDVLGGYAWALLLLLPVGFACYRPGRSV